MEPNFTETLRSVFGYGAFRPHQEEIVATLVRGEDAFVLMPTGGGKSLCFQVPALHRPGTAIVVSPLISLMKDQVDALCANGVRAACYNSSLGAAEARRVLAALHRGELDLLYVAPERLLGEDFLARLAELPIALFAVDEAHCVSQWGHDFRPDYFRLADAARKLGASALIASTATATPRVAADVIRRLALRDPLRVATGFDRPNISFSVARPGGHVVAGHQLRGQVGMAEVDTRVEHRDHDTAARRPAPGFGRPHLLRAVLLAEERVGRGARVRHPGHQEAESGHHDEDATPHPRSPYGVTKLAAEHLCRLYHAEHGVEAVALRYFSVYGPRQRPDMAFRRFCEAVIERRPIEIFGDEKAVRKKIMGIVTDTRSPTEPKPDAEKNIALQLLKLVATAEVAQEFESRLRAGGETCHTGYSPLTRPARSRSPSSTPRATGLPARCPKARPCSFPAAWNGSTAAPPWSTRTISCRSNRQPTCPKSNPSIR